MTRTAANLAIATALEAPEGLLPVDIALIDSAILSPKGFWVSLALYENDDMPKWYPVDFFTDENASARLLEAMPEPVLRGGNMPNVGVNHVRFYKCAAAPGGPMITAGDRKTAIALAAMRWLHIDGTIEG